MKISSWPFASSTNSLQILMRSEALSQDGNQCHTTNIGNDNNQNLRWIEIEQNGVTLYGTFESAALIDSNIKSVQFSYNSSSGLTNVLVPHFWVDAEFDPDFQVLLNPSAANPCNIGAGQNQILGTVGLAVLVSVLGFAVIVAVGMFIWRSLYLKRLQQKLNRARLVNDSSLTKLTNDL